MNKSLKEKIIELYNNGFSYNSISKKLSCSKGTINYHLSSFVKKRYDNKKLLIEKIKNNLPENRKKLLQLYGDVLTKREIQYFYSTFYKIENKGTKSNCIPKEYYKNRRLNLKKELVEYKGGKCEICDYDRCIKALEFHHLDPNKKDFAISNCGLKDIVKLKKEVDKCALLCSNCHREVHDGLHNTWLSARVVEEVGLQNR